MSAACYHFFNTHCIYRIHPPDWPEKDTHRNTSEKMSDGHVKIEWEDKLNFLLVIKDQGLTSGVNFSHDEAIIFTIFYGFAQVYLVQQHK